MKYLVKETAVTPFTKSTIIRYFGTHDELVACDAPWAHKEIKPEVVARKGYKTEKGAMKNWRINHPFNSVEVEIVGIEC